MGPCLQLQDCEIVRPACERLLMLFGAFFSPAGGSAAIEAKDGDKQMEADEDLARQLQAKMDAEMRAK